MYVYGPVESRRLGRSLGVNLVYPKTCSYSCIYCQLGRTNYLQIKRDSFYPKEEILSQIIKACSKSSPDYISIIGNGEPTLFRYLGWLIRNIKNQIATRVAVVTNGSLLYRKDVRQDLENADLVMPSIDAGDERLFNIINRPHSGIDFQTVIGGMVEFRQCYTGQLWIEIMLIRGLNDSEPELLRIKSIVERIAPDRVYLITPVRPPAESWVMPPEHERILAAQEIFAESIPIVEYESDNFDLKNYDSAEQAILSIGRHHPLRKEQIEKIEFYFKEPETLSGLIESGQVKHIKYNNFWFYIPNDNKQNVIGPNIKE